MTSSTPGFTDMGIISHVYIYTKYRFLQLPGIPPPRFISRLLYSKRRQRISASCSKSSKKTSSTLIKGHIDSHADTIIVLSTI